MCFQALFKENSVHEVQLLSNTTNMPVGQVVETLMINLGDTSSRDTLGETLILGSADVSLRIG